MSSTRNLFVYPGHALVIAKIIMETYPSLEAASRRVGDKEHNTAAALGDSNVPGAGGCVWVAIDTLRYFHTEGVTKEQTFQFADRYWNASVSDLNTRVDGQQKADSIKEEVYKMAMAWPQE